MSKRAFFKQAQELGSLAPTYDAAKTDAVAYQARKAAIRGIESDEQAEARIMSFLRNSHDEVCPDGPCAPFGAWLRTPLYLQHFSC